MAQIESWFSQDLAKAVKVQYLDGNVFSADNEGNKIGVVVTNNGEPVTLTGSISGVAVRCDGGSVALTGGFSNNKAWVTLPSAAYAVPGLLSIIIKNTNSTQITTLCAVVAYVYIANSDQVIDPGEVIPSVEELIAAIEAAIASIPADYSSLWTSLAPVFSSSVSYNPGQYVTYDGNLYRFNNSHSGSWASGDVTAVAIGGELRSIRNTIAPEFDSSTAYTAGDFVYHEGDLYKIMEDHAAGVTWANTSKTSTTIEAAKRHIYEQIAEQFSTSVNYNVNDYVIRNNNLYRFINQHNAGAWKSADVTAVNLGDDVAGLLVATGNGFVSKNVPANANLNTITDVGLWYINGGYTYTNYPYNNNYNAFMLVTKSGYVIQQILFPYFFSSSAGSLNEQCMRRIYNGSAWSEWQPFEYKNNAILSGLTANAIQIQGGLPGNTDLDNIKTPGVWFCGTGEGYTHYPFDSSWASWLVVFTTASIVQQLLIPYFISDSAQTLQATPLRRNFNGTSWGSWKWNANPNAIETLAGDPFTGSEIDLNNIVGNHFYLLNDSHTYTNKPTGFTIGFLETVLTGQWSIQLLWPFNGGKMWKRRGNDTGSAWESWQEISGTINNYSNQYAFNEYSNTYQQTVSPIIITDTNAYLAPTGDTTDVTASIVALLTSHGICRLGKGDYYVNNLEMPANTSIVGTGNGTRIILSGSSDGFAIKMNDFCNVSDCKIVGNTSGITLSSTVGGRHGILWQGNYTSDETSANQPKNGMVSNVRFSGFTGGAITCYDTGFGTFNALEVINVYCENCNAGINISYFSEFHKFTNVRTASCYYGCINNGGNNTFVNCDFSTCKIGFLMDNSTGQSPNNSHGQCVGCVFNHTDSNTGIGIKILNCDNGFIFDACQIFFSQIYIDDSNGVTVSNSNFGSSNCNITVSNGGAVLFANNMHQTAPTIIITNNNKVHFANCYVRDTGAVVSN